MIVVIPKGNRASINPNHQEKFNLQLLLSQLQNPEWRRYRTYGRKASQIIYSRRQFKPILVFRIDLQACGASLGSWFYTVPPNIIYEGKIHHQLGNLSRDTLNELQVISAFTLYVNN